jgi:transcriptional regulator with XRE-family HTH domain
MRLAVYLFRKKLTQSEFADAINVPPGTVSRYVSGVRSPSWDHLERIFWATSKRVTPNDFLAERMARRRKSVK